jgi:hypothetical protein
MNRKEARSRRDLVREKFLSTYGLRTRLRNLGLLDWFVIGVAVIALGMDIYLRTLRHP